ncbi:hypothetical protein [Halopiger djelfimassiliensis]|uniref:hypothetical protein n=1 Tax=Halopiger djelfimassiliensis TaxID=1293047 RepID=UPI0006778168|nr:hypothetical protein [Halopiger djelfimassiliensis]
MTNTGTRSRDTGLFQTPFSIGAAVVSAVSFIVAALVGWTGYQGSELMVVGTELDIITGAVGFMFAAFIGVVALVAAVYMEPGFDY